MRYIRCNEEVAMKRMSGGLRSSGAMLVVALAVCPLSCSSVRVGSLVPGQRSLDYESGIVSWELANQLTVALMPDQRVNLVSVDVRYTVGAADEPPGKTGLAHLVEHVMFARRVSPGGPSVHDRLAAAVLHYESKTDWQWTHYTAIGLAPQLDELLAIEAERMGSGCDGIDNAAVAFGRAIVLEELAERDAADVSDTLHHAVFGPEHAYGHGVGGRDVATLTRDDVCQFIDTFYAPSRAILVVSGSIPETATRNITTRFGSIARRASGQHAVLWPLAWTGEVSELPLPVDEPGVLVMFPAAPWGSTEWIYDNLVDQLVYERLWQIAWSEPWVDHVWLEHFGGELGGARGFRLRLYEVRRIDDAIAAVFAAIRDLPSSIGDRWILAAANARASEVLDAFGSIDARGRWYATSLQFSVDRRFPIRELTELQHIDLARLRARMARLGRDVSRVVKLVPSHARAGDASFTASTPIDLPPWRAPVDPVEANHPIVLPRDPRPSRLTEQRLANGLRVVMLPDSRQPIFDARLVFPVGETATWNGKAGLAIAAAQMLIHDFPSQFVPKPLKVAFWVLELGAPVARVVSDHTTFHVHGASPYADAHLWRLHWLLANGRYERSTADRMQEFAHHDAARSARLRVGDRAMREALFGLDHPLVQDRPTMLARNAGSLRPENLEHFRDAYYRANGATLILVGHFDPEAMMKLVNELFGAWPSEPSPALAPIPPSRPVTGPTWIADVDPDAVQVRVSLAFAATSARTARGARLVVAEMVRDRVKRVCWPLAASHDIEAAYGSGVDRDLLGIVGLLNAARAGEAMRRIQADLDGLRTGDAEFAADFVRARRTALNWALGDPMRTTAAADRLEAVVANDLLINAVETLPAEIASTTIDTVRAVIAQDLQVARMVLMLSGREQDTSAAFAAMGVTRFTTVREQPAAR
jgi:zinc protease